MNLNEALNEATQRDDDDVWITYDRAGIASLDVGPEPPFSNDAGLLQINLSTFFKDLLYVLQD